MHVTLEFLEMLFDIFVLLRIHICTYIKALLFEEWMLPIERFLKFLVLFFWNILLQIEF